MNGRLLIFYCSNVMDVKLVLLYFSRKLFVKLVTAMFSQYSVVIALDQGASNKLIFRNLLIPTCKQCL